MSHSLSPTLLLPVVLLLAACRSTGPADDPDTVVAELFAADHAFYLDARQRGLEGWVSWFAPHGARVPVEGEPAHGLAEIRAADAALFADPTIQLHWKPETGGVLVPGELGYTRGRYHLVRSDEGLESVLGTGTYLSIWTRTVAGWRVALDTGVPDGE